MVLSLPCRGGRVVPRRRGPTLTAGAIVDKMTAQEIALMSLAGQQQQAAAAHQRVALAAGVQLRLLELYWTDQDEPVLDDSATAETIAAAAVRHADALLAALASSKGASRY